MTCVTINKIVLASMRFIRNDYYISSIRQLGVFQFLFTGKIFLNSSKNANLKHIRIDTEEEISYFEVLVDIKETIKGFNMIMDGEVDEYPEAAFNLVGTIDEAIAKGKKMLEESK